MNNQVKSRDYNQLLASSLPPKTGGSYHLVEVHREERGGEEGWARTLKPNSIHGHPQERLAAGGITNQHLKEKESVELGREV